MKYLRCLARVHYRALLTFAFAALAMQALVPAGLMVAPAAGFGAQIILCPQTHPLARAVAAKSSSETTAMHAAMGHAPASPDEPASGASAASGGQSCAFAGAGALAGLLPERNIDFAPQTTESALPPTALQALRLVEAPRLRPPLRAPPALI